MNLNPIDLRNLQKVIGPNQENNLIYELLHPNMLRKQTLNKQAVNWFNFPFAQYTKVCPNSTSFYVIILGHYFIL